MAVINLVGNTLIGQSGTGEFVGSVGATLTTPIITGITSGTNQAAGNVGEVISTTVLYASAISLTSDMAFDLCSASFTAGDWDIWGQIFYTFSLGASTAQGWSSTTSATGPNDAFIAQLTMTAGYINNVSCVVSPLRYNFSTTTTVYISGIAGFSTGTGTACGFIYGRRRD